MRDKKGIVNDLKEIGFVAYNIYWIGMGVYIAANAFTKLHKKYGNY